MPDVSAVGDVLDKAAGRAGNIMTRSRLPVAELVFASLTAPN
jgi:hypothetical protein